MADIMTHTCDCGFTWRHGHSGSHLCEPLYRETIAKLRAALAAATAPQQPAQDKPAAQELHSLRLQVYEQGKRMVDDCLDSDDVEGIGAQLCALTRVCTYCHGSGEDGDDADANGEGGWIGRCYKCGGEGIAAAPAPDTGGTG